MYITNTYSVHEHHALQVPAVISFQGFLTFMASRNSLPFHFIHPPLCFFIHSTPWTISIRVMNISALIDNWVKVFRSILEVLFCWLNKILIISYMDFSFKYAIAYKTMNQRILMSWMKSKTKLHVNKHFDNLCIISIIVFSTITHCDPNVAKTVRIIIRRL